MRRMIDEYLYAKKPQKWVSSGGAHEQLTIPASFIEENKAYRFIPLLKGSSSSQLHLYIYFDGETPTPISIIDAIVVVNNFGAKYIECYDDLGNVIKNLTDTSGTKDIIFSTGAGNFAPFEIVLYDGN